MCTMDWQIAQDIVLVTCALKYKGDFIEEIICLHTYTAL